MTDTTIFNPDQDKPEPVVTPSVTPVIPPELSELVGEGKKYKSVDDAMKALPHAQQHILTLQQENALMKEELTKRKTAEELLEDIRRTTQAPTATTQGTDISHDVVSQIVQQQLRAASEQTIMKANTDKVVNAFREVYGEDAKNKFNSIAASNGMSPAQLEMLVTTSPEAVLNLAGINNKRKTPDTTLKSDVNTQTTFSNSLQDNTSAKVPIGASSKDLAKAWANTREKVYKDLNITQ